MKTKYEYYLSKREQVLKEFKRFAEAYNVEFDYGFIPIGELDLEKFNADTYIRCNDQLICVTESSIDAICTELLGYIKCILGQFNPSKDTDLKRYWSKHSVTELRI